MGQHVVIFDPFRVGGVEVESGASAKVPVGVFAVDPGSPRRGVGKEEGDSLGGCGTEESTFLRSGAKSALEKSSRLGGVVPVVLGAGQTSQIHKQRDVGRRGLWREKEIEVGMEAPERSGLQS